MSEQILAAKIKAFDEFSATFQRYEQSLRKLGQTQNEASQSTERISKSTRDFLSVLGGVGTLYAFQRGMQVVAQTGREFELAIKQAQAVTGNLTSDLRDMAMATKGIYGPTEAAKAYYELGSAGLATNEILKTTPDVLNFATAGMLKMEDSAYAVSSTVKAFGLEWGQTTQVVDAFTAAMNSTAMKAEDFKWVMGTVGAVGKMAGQDFKEVIGAAAAMRDAGVQAQDAGTSVKSALLAMINPSDEAQKTIEALGLKFYDSAGKMKQWHEIIAEYERVLAPYNEQSRNLIMTTIAGSDGIRALSTGLRMGSAMDWVRSAATTSLKKIRAK
jgi:TP901 family phage tail tape measure protein